MHLPMFPLGNVVLPGELLPLNVFEPRYRRLVLDCLAADTPDFGVVLIERGSEVGGGDVRASIGTVARIARVAPLGNGRFQVVAAGLRRLSVLEWMTDDPYPTADVETWADAGPVDSISLRLELDRLVERVETARHLALEVARAEHPDVSPPPDPPVTLAADLVQAVYQLAARAPIGPVDRHRLLGAATLEARVQVLGSALDDADAMLRFRLA